MTDWWLARGGKIITAAGRDSWLAARRGVVSASILPPFAVGGASARRAILSRLAGERLGRASDDIDNAAMRRGREEDERVKRMMADGRDIVDGFIFEAAEVFFGAPSAAVGGCAATIDAVGRTTAGEPAICEIKAPVKTQPHIGRYIERRRIDLQIAAQMNAAGVATAFAAIVDPETGDIAGERIFAAADPAAEAAIAQAVALAKIIENRIGDFERRIVADGEQSSFADDCQDSAVWRDFPLVGGTPPQKKYAAALRARFARHLPRLAAAAAGSAEAARRNLSRAEFRDLGHLFIARLSSARAWCDMNEWITSAHDSADAADLFIRLAGRLRNGR